MTSPTPPKAIVERIRQLDVLLAPLGVQRRGGSSVLIHSAVTFSSGGGKLLDEEQELGCVYVIDGRVAVELDTMRPTPTVPAVVADAMQLHRALTERVAQRLTQAGVGVVVVTALQTAATSMRSQIGLFHLAETWAGTAVPSPSWIRAWLDGACLRVIDAADENRRRHEVEAYVEAVLEIRDALQLAEWGRRDDVQARLTLLSAQGDHDAARLLDPGLQELRGEALSEALEIRERLIR